LSRAGITIKFQVAATWKIDRLIFEKLNRNARDKKRYAKWILSIPCKQVGVLKEAPTDSVKALNQNGFYRYF
jgi:hypothetical protein